MKTPDSSVARDLRPVDYEKPPVIETALALIYLPIKGWNVFHLGLFWARVRNRYQHAEARLPTGSIQLDDLNLSIGPDSRLESIPLRSWLLDSSGNQLLQVQANAFIRNWRAVEAEQKYVHYSDLKPIFEEDWSTYRLFLEEESLPEPNVFQCEVTYINHFVKGREWETLDDVVHLFQGLKLEIKGTVVSSLSLVARKENNQVRMEAVPAIRPDGTPIVQFTLNVSGKPRSTSETDVLAKLDECHDLLVRTFADITAPDLQTKIWKRIK